MKIISKAEHKFKKGEIYTPDSINLVSEQCGKYFEEVDEAGRYKEFEYGTSKCTKSFSVTIIIKA